MKEATVLGTKLRKLIGFLNPKFFYITVRALSSFVFSTFESLKHKDVCNIADKMLIILILSPHK